MSGSFHSVHVEKSKNGRITVLIFGRAVHVNENSRIKFHHEPSGIRASVPQETESVKFLPKESNVKKGSKIIFYKAPYKLNNESKEYELVCGWSKSWEYSLALITWRIKKSLRLI